MIRLTCEEDGSSKFWEAAVEGASLTTRWGKIGTAGQSKSKDFATPAAAEKELAKLTAEKRKKGYVDADGAPPVAAPRGPTAMRAVCTTDAGIVALWAAGAFDAITDHESWERALLDDADIALRISEGRIVPLSTGSDGAFDVELRIGDELSPAEKGALEQRSEPYALVVSAGVVLSGIEFVHREPDPNTTRSFALPEGRWAARVHALSGKKKTPNVLVLLSPAPAEWQPRTKLAIFEPRAEKPAKKGGPLKTVKAAGAAARAGELEPAIDALEVLAGKGEIEACAALAEIHAYRSEWAAFFPRAAAVLATSAEVIGNTTNELAWALLLAGHETGRWKDVAAIVDALPEKVRGWPLHLHLAAQAKAGGALTDPPFRKHDADEKKAKLRAEHAAAMAPDKVQLRTKGDPARVARDLFFCAQAYWHEEEAIAAYRAGEAHMTWDDSVKVARLLLARDQANDAWAALERKLPAWHALSWAQIAPMELVCCERLRTIVTPERRAQVLRTARS
jgi:predicted DNA-binding WGR domain protein